MTRLLHAAEFVASGFRPVPGWVVPQLRMRRRLVRLRNRVIVAAPAGVLVALGVVLGRLW